jgi:hypothetical protein
MDKKVMYLEIADLNQMSLSTETGQLTVDCELLAGPEELIVRLCFSQQVTKQLALNLGRMQTVLETEVEGAPPSDARH